MTLRSDLTADELDRRIEEYCTAKGWRFMPWEVRPWEVDLEGGPHPTYPPGHPVCKQWPRAQRLRRQIEAEILGAAKS